MRPSTLIGVLAVLLGAAVCSAAEGPDLAKIERKLSREPVYRSGAPRYCLLVFGPEAKTRIWLVLDGDVLYVDRNGNGDLTEEGEQVAAAKPRQEGGSLLSFEAGAVLEADGTKHADLRVVRFGRTSANASVSLDVAGRGRQTADTDAAGSLAFGDKPETAPIIYFNGPLQIRLTAEKPLSRTGRPERLNSCLGTPGVGPGTLAVLVNDDVPEDVHPVAELEFRSTKGAIEPERRTVKLDHRC